MLRDVDTLSYKALVDFPNGTDFALDTVIEA